MKGNQGSHPQRHRCYRQIHPPRLSGSLFRLAQGCVVGVKPCKSRTRPPLNKKQTGAFNKPMNNGGTLIKPIKKRSKNETSALPQPLDRPAPPFSTFGRAPRWPEERPDPWPRRTPSRLVVTQRSCRGSTADPRFISPSLLTWLLSAPLLKV